MSDSNIPIIEPTIDYTKVPPIHQKRTISFINHFIVNTVAFLNKLALTCEEKLFEFENKLQRVEAAVVILESRLASIPGLDDKSPIAKDSSNSNVEKESNKAEIVPVQEATDDVDEIDKETTESQATEVQTTETQENLQSISSHPLYIKYFKMVKVRVPIAAVKMKMAAEGLNPDLLDNPQLQVPKVDSEELSTTS